MRDFNTDLNFNNVAPLISGVGGNDKILGTDASGKIALLDTDQGYTIFPIWAEESGALSNNNRQWSFGNGATGNINVTLPVDCEVFALSFEAEVAGTSVSIELMRENLAVNSYLFNGNADFVTLATPIPFTPGQRIGFRTDVETGAYSDCRVTAWFRIRSTRGATSVLNDLLDVSVSTIQAGQLLQYNGSVFVPFNLPDQLDRVIVSTVTDSTTNVNFATFTNAPVFGSNRLINDNGSFTALSATQIEINFDGEIVVNSNIAFFSTGARSAPQGVLAINGTPVPARASSGYIRNSSGHNESSLHLSDIYIPVSDGDILSYQIQRESTITTAITMQANQGQISIKRVRT